MEQTHARHDMQVGSFDATNERRSGLSRISPSYIDLGVQSCLAALTNRIIDPMSDLCLLVRFVGPPNEVAKDKDGNPR
jgi:hypothetical protein